MPDETPNLHLTLTDDARVNANWAKIDALAGVLATATIIPGDLQVQGNLDVTGNASVAGTLSSGNITAPGANLGAATIANLTIGSSLIAPPHLIPQGMLAQAAAVEGAWIGTVANGTVNATVTTQQQLCTVATDSTEDPARWSLIIGNISFQVGLNADPGTSQPVAWNVGLFRGDPPGQLQQSRNLAYTLTKSGFFYVPITILRVAKPPAPVGAYRWDLAATMTTTNATVQLTWAFAQLQVIQLT